jgi:hypothetical protein
MQTRLVRDYVLAIDGDRPVLPVATVTLRPDHSPLFRLGRRHTLRAGRAAAALVAHHVRGDVPAGPDAAGLTGASPSTATGRCCRWRP